MGQSETDAGRTPCVCWGFSWRRRPRRVKLAKPLFGLHPSFDRAMVLFQDIVQGLDRPMSAAAAQGAAQHGGGDARGGGDRAALSAGAVLGPGHLGPRAGAACGHRCRVFGGRLGYRAGYYSRGLGTRIASAPGVREPTLCGHLPKSVARRVRWRLPPPPPSRVGARATGFPRGRPRVFGGFRAPVGVLRTTMFGADYAKGPYLDSSVKRKNETEVQPVV